jgi:5-methylcytosine-specific restriction enzyme subunit McrC
MTRKSVCIREFGFLVSDIHGFSKDDKLAHNVRELPDKSYESLMALQYSESSRDADIQPFLKPTTYRRKPALQVRNYVGVLQTACGTQIEVLPKLYDSTSKGSDDHSRVLLLKMLKTLRDSPFKQAGRADIRDSKMPLLEVYISQFLSLVNDLVKRGIRSDYIQVQKNSKFLKGRLLVSQQIRKNSIHADRFFVEHSEYQVNRPANRLIKTALLKVSGLARSNRNQRLSRELNFVFEEVPKSTDFVQDFKKVKLDRGMHYYEEALEWSKLLLSGLGPTASSGDFNTLTLLYPMERIFEDYVAHCLRDQVEDISGTGARLKTQVGGKALVEDHVGKTIFRLRPDLMITKDKLATWVLDTKWKLLDQGNRSKKYGISQSDMYQLYAYGHKFLDAGNKNLMLIYPMTKKFTEALPVFRYEDGFELWVVPFDIANGELLLPSSEVSGVFGSHHYE